MKGVNEIVSVCGNKVADGDVLCKLLGQVEGKIEKLIADKAYDRKKCYVLIKERGEKGVIPPRRGAVIWKHGNSKGERNSRDETLMEIRGYARWLFFRKKMIFFERVGARSFAGHVGLPDSYAI